VDTAVKLGKEFRRLGVSSVEQPIAAGNAEALAYVQSEGGIPVVADESLCTLKDAEALLSAGAAHVWNIRLAKVGGFSGALQLARLAQEHGIEMQLGVLVGETSLLGAAARACIGLARYRHVEFGFPRILLRADPFRKGPDGYLGTGHPLDSSPGLGVWPASTVLDRLTLNRKTLD
jgi:L-alanine-DL-glutamate epimerase-like enolase superfamily enzyme